MTYHIDTGLIWEVFKKDTECPLCEIKKVVEEQYLHEFLNDAVMEDNTRIAVGKKGFCGDHLAKLMARPNKLSVALQLRTRLEKTEDLFLPLSSTKQASKKAKEIRDSLSTCIICDYVNESMVKYFKTIAQMYNNEPEFRETLKKCKGFCLSHYADLLDYSSHAGLFIAKEYVGVLSKVQKVNICRLDGDLKAFCDKHDYRNALKPLGNAQFALKNTSDKLHGKKFD